MNAYGFLCILYKVILSEDRPILLECIKNKASFEGLSLNTVINEQFDATILCKQLSKAQKLLLFSYGYLYYRLRDERQVPAYMQQWMPVLEIDEKVRGYIQSVWTQERMAYIKKHFEKQGVSVLAYLIDTPQYIQLFLEKQIEDLLVNNRLGESKGERVVLTALSALEYEHPEDHKLLEALRGNAMLEKPFKLFVEYDIERFIKVQYTGSNIRVTKQNIPFVYKAVETACRILQVEKMPEIYIQQGFSVNACTTGIENPIIILNAGSLSLLTYEELLFIIGHEVGHIKSQHLMYHMMGQALPYLAEIASQMTLGIGGIISIGLQISLYNWYRKSELTADRAGLLVCQDHKVAISALMKCAGYPPKFYDTMNEEDFLKQVEQFESLDTEAYNKVVKVLSTLYQTHPWTVLRAKELNLWFKQGEYDGILSRRKAH